jgi:hypothetical protein
MAAEDGAFEVGEGEVCLSQHLFDGLETRALDITDIVFDQGLAGHGHCKSIGHGLLPVVANEMALD